MEKIKIAVLITSFKHDYETILNPAHILDYIPCNDCHLKKEECLGKNKPYFSITLTAILCSDIIACFFRFG